MLMNTKRKTALVFLALSVLALLISGCWDSTEVNDLAVITTVGLDLAEDRQLELSVKIYLTSPAASQQSGGGMSEPGGGDSGKSVVRWAKGVNMADAASKLQKLITRKVFWGQAEAFIFGERLAREGLTEPMDYLIRHPTPRERANVFVSESTAKEVLLLDPPIERSVADALREMAKSQTGLNITMKELAQMMAGKSKAAVIPIVKIQPKQENQEPFVFVQGTAILKNGKMVGLMDDDVTRGVMWLRNEVKRATVTVTPKNTQGYVSVQMLRSRTRLIPQIQGDDWSITVRIEALDEIIQNTTDLDLSVPKHLEQLEKALGDDINHRMNMALAQAQKKMKADIFQFADEFYRKYPKEWGKNKDRWDEIFPNVDVRLETNVKIARPGLVGKNPFKEQR